MRVLMFGWEFPPYKTGGLGTACHDLTKGLSQKGIDVTFVMPVAPKGTKTPFAHIIGATTYPNKTIAINALLTPYATPHTYSQTHHETTGSDVYGKNLFEEVQRYAAVAQTIAHKHPHDIIHAHDWMTYPAALNARELSKKPLVAHIHATEFDRTLGKPHPVIARIEREGLLKADVVIANSNFLKKTVIEQYNIPAQKIHVAHWGIDQENTHSTYKSTLQAPLVLYLGRMTAMKGPDHFLCVAKKVLTFEPKTKFIMAGGGDMFPAVVKLAAELGISQNVIFTGPLSGNQTHYAFQLADLFVMPSIREPFGLVALEALKNNTPVLISKQSGVNEVLHNALKVDFWDHKEMVNKIVAVLRHKSLRDTLREKGATEVQHFTLDHPAQTCIDIYHSLLQTTVIA